jgi:hypothetical protein
VGVFTTLHNAGLPAQRSRRQLCHAQRVQQKKVEVTTLALVLPGVFLSAARFHDRAPFLFALTSPDVAAALQARREKYFNRIAKLS